MDEWRDILRGLGENLILEKELGRTGVELSPEIAAFVRAPVASVREKSVPPPASAAAPDQSETVILFVCETPMPADGGAMRLLRKMTEAMGLEESEWRLCPLYPQPPADERAKEAAADALVKEILRSAPKVAVVFGGGTARGLLKNPKAVLAPGQWVKIGSVPTVLSREPELVVRLEKAQDMANLRAIKLEIWNKALVPALKKAGRDPAVKR